MPSNSHCRRTLIFGLPRSTSGRISSIEQADFFFEPVQFHLQPPNLFVERVAVRFRFAALARPPVYKSSGSCSRAAFLHFAIWMGCTLNCDPNWLSVFSPRIASIATLALNFGLYCFLVVVIDLSAVNDS